MLEQFNAVSRRRFKADFMTMSFDGVVQMVTFLSVVLFLWVGARQVIDGALTIGALVAFSSLVALANGPIINLLSMWDGLQIVQLLLNRLNDVFEPEPEQGADRARLLPVSSLEGRVSFENMSFRYGGPDSPPILEGITLEVPAGKMVAVVEAGELRSDDPDRREKHEEQCRPGAASPEAHDDRSRCDREDVPDGQHPPKERLGAVRHGRPTDSEVLRRLSGTRSVNDVELTQSGGLRGGRSRTRLNWQTR
jgi:hypothetical protein